MIAWRDKRISMLEELIGAMEQADRIYAAYIAYLLARCGDKTGQIKISKKEIRDVCGKYAVRAQDAGEQFLITLTEAGEEHEVRSSEMADA